MTSAVVVIVALWSGTFLARADDRTFDVLTAGVQDVQDAVAAGALTYERLVQIYLNRIAAYDKRGPRLNAVIQVNKRALNVARMLDAERRRTGLRSQLHGIPIAVKDNIDVQDLPSAGGNVALAGSYPARDATVIAKLRAAGAIIFLKTNLDEFALGSQGLSSLGGQTRNAFDPRRSPGGSSGGTAVAVRAAFATVGLATETGQSTRGPAANAALVAIVPTRGLVSRTGVMPVSFTQDRIGVHARTVTDAALLLATVQGFDVEDLHTSAALEVMNEAASTREQADEEGGHGRLGVLRELFPQGERFAPANALVDAALARLRPGVPVVDGLTTPLGLPTLVPSLRVNNFELRFALDAYFSRRGPASPVRSLAALIKSGKYLKDLDSRFTVAMKVTSLDTDPEYRARLMRQRDVRGALIALMDRERVDALVYPVKSLPAPLLGEPEVGGAGDNPFSSVTGLPAVVVPVGLHPEGLPIGMELLGRPFDEKRLLRLAAAYERIGGPSLLPSTAPHLAGDTFRYQRK